MNQQTLLQKEHTLELVELWDWRGDDGPILTYVCECGFGTDFPEFNPKTCEL